MKYLAMLLLVAGTASADPAMVSRIDQLEHRVDEILEKLDAGTQGSGHTWYCQAFCGGFTGFELYGRRVNSNAATPDVAFTGLDDECNESLFTGTAVDDRGRPASLQYATLANSCVRH